MRLRFHIAAICIILLPIVNLSAAYKDDVRYTELANELNLRSISVPTGGGVGVTQVESYFNAVEAFVPSSASEFTGKTITDQTGGGTTSDHATWVGQNLYGNITSIAPGISTINVYSSNDWLDNRGWLNNEPEIETNPLQNHSWIFDTTSTNASIRMDYAIGRDGFLSCAGLNNKNSTTVPSTYGSIYNGITVGRTDGGHSRGGTVYDTAGRTKPEIVAPGGIPGSNPATQFTSFATPIITAAAAFLIDAAGSNAAAKDQLTLKALLLAGADKSISASWDQTPTRPIDEVYGAGELDIYESYFIQQAGQQSANSTIEQRGWNKASLSNNGSHTYTLQILDGFVLRNISALITWNRIVAKTGPNYNPSLADLSLSLKDDSDNSTLQSSDSPVDNIEHIWRGASSELSVGTYSLVVATDDAVDYAIAWRSELYQDYTLWVGANFNTTPISEQGPSDDPEGDGIANLLEQAFGGDPEESDINILPISQIVIDAGQSYLQISYRKPGHENDLTYTVETITDLNGTWSSQSAEVVLVSIATETGGFDRYTYRRVEPLSAHEKAFLRVSVTQ